MGATTKLTFEDWQQLPDREGKIYELDEGELLMEPSPALRHNLIRQRIATRLREYVESGRLGVVIEEMDFRLGPDTVRNPDVAFMAQEHFANTDIDRSPVQGAPALAVEVVSPNNRAEDMVKKTRQYLQAGARSVWIIYPKMRLVEIHSSKGVHTIQEPQTLKDEILFPKLSISLPYIFDGT